MLTLRNPHSVLAALRNRPKDVQWVRVSARSGDADAWGEVAELAREVGVKVESGGARAAGDPRARGRRKPDDRDGPGRASGSEALVRERDAVPIERLFEGAQGSSGLWIGLDCLQDPQNVGAIFRTAAFFGVRGALITQERSAALTSTVYDVASGGLESVPFTIEVNLRRALEAAKETGLWILGTSERARGSIDSVSRDRAWLAVFGNEERGVRRLTEESCDLLCAIAPKGAVKSLNVSVAAGIVISRLG